MCALSVCSAVVPLVCSVRRPKCLPLEDAVGDVEVVEAVEAELGAEWTPFPSTSEVMTCLHHHPHLRTQFHHRQEPERTLHLWRRTSHHHHHRRHHRPRCLRR